MKKRKMRIKAAQKVHTCKTARRRQMIVCMGMAVLFVCFLRYHFNYERKVNRFVLKYEAELTEMAEDYLAADSGERLRLFETSNEKTFHGAQLTGLFPEEVAAFYMGGFGLVPSASYYGFYYSPDDIPISNGEGTLRKIPDEETDRMRKTDSKSQKECWYWQGYGDNGGEIVKIKEHWYYYKCWF